MQNPWHALADDPPYLLLSDQRAVLAHNERVPEVLQVKHNVLPEPYLGRADAPVLLLNLNPGYAEEDITFYSQANVRQLWRKNLLHEKMEYPFWLLDPTLDPDVGGTRWWRQKLRELIETAGLKRVATDICCIELFPYHSRRYAPLRETLEAQQYSFHLVHRAIQNGTVIVVMRSERQWITTIPELKDYGQLFRLRNPQNVAVSRRNCPEGYSMIEQLLQK